MTPEIMERVASLRAAAQRLQIEREREKIQSVIRYCRNRTNPNLIRILYANYLEGDARTARELIEQCHHRNPCGVYGCANCGRKFKEKEKLKALKKIVAKCGRFPNPDRTSFVTINGPVVALDPEAMKPAFERFRRQLCKRQTAHLGDTSWMGYFDISLSGMLHWHGAILHPECSKRALGSKLRHAFPGDRTVKVSKWDKEKTFLENLDCIIDYSLVSDRHAKVIFDKPIKGPETAALIAQRIVCLQEMARRGVQGIRLCLNMKSTRVWKAGVLFDEKTRELIVVPEMEARILRRRRKARKDRRWDRPERIALWPRRKATERIRTGRPSVTSSPELDHAWDESEWD